MRIIIDADPIVYRCGFASERTSWHLVYDATGSGEVDEIQFNPDDERSAGDYMREWLAANSGVTVLDKSRVVTPDPVSYALRATQVQIESIVAECESHFKTSGKMFMWISGAGGSYRDKLATVRPYKGNRDPTHKPYHYHAIREYLRSSYGAFVTRGIEADDAVSIFARQQLEGGESVVVCTIDKDLDQIPGHHYNYMNKVHYAITQQESERWFIYQILAGDITDNILGVWKCGDKCASVILEHCGGIFSGSRPNDEHGTITDGQPAEPTIEPITGDAGIAPVQCKRRLVRISEYSVADTESESGAGSITDIAKSPGSMARLPEAGQSAAASSTSTVHGRAARSPKWWPTIVRAFADSQRKPGCPYASRDPEAIAIETAQLVKLQEYPGQLWHPNGDLVVPGFGQEDFDE